LWLRKKKIPPVDEQGQLLKPRKRRKYKKVTDRVLWTVYSKLWEGQRIVRKAFSASDSPYTVIPEKHRQTVKKLLLSILTSAADEIEKGLSQEDGIVLVAPTIYNKARDVPRAPFLCEPENFLDMDLWLKRREDVHRKIPYKYRKSNFFKSLTLEQFGSFTFFLAEAWTMGFKTGEEKKESPLDKDRELSQEDGRSLDAQSG
jgi:hypothetical protein